jgi:hypothetical protein
VLSWSFHWPGMPSLRSSFMWRCLSCCHEHQSKGPVKGPGWPHAGLALLVQGLASSRARSPPRDHQLQPPQAQDEVPAPDLLPLRPGVHKGGARLMPEGSGPADPGDFAQLLCCPLHALVQAWHRIADQGHGGKRTTFVYPIPLHIFVPKPSRPSKGPARGHLMHISRMLRGCIKRNWPGCSSPSSGYRSLSCCAIFLGVGMRGQVIDLVLVIAHLNSQAPLLVGWKGFQPW